MKAYLGDSSSFPHSVMNESESFSPAIQTAQYANDFLAKEVTLPSVITRIKDDDKFDDGHYFELVADVASLSSIDDIECICKKTYTRGMCFVSFYFEGVFYVVLQDASEEVALLDVEFPQITRQSNGITLALYDNDCCVDDSVITWRKLSLWSSVADDVECTPNELDKPLSLASSSYLQSYAVLKPNKPDASMRDVLFRFGSWCYNGVAELIPSLCIRDIQHLIPAVRMQQHRLTFLCHSSEMSQENLFAEPLAYVSKLSQLMEREVVASIDTIKKLQKRSKIDIDDDPENLFFEFKPSSNTRTILDKSHIDCIATKCYRPDGIIVINVYFDGIFYVCMSTGDETQPLLDSTFPSIVQGKGFQLKTYPCGIEGWPELRKLSLWKNLESLGSNPEKTETDEPNDMNSTPSFSEPKCERPISKQYDETKHDAKHSNEILDGQSIAAIEVSESKTYHIVQNRREKKRTKPEHKTIAHSGGPYKHDHETSYTSLHARRIQPKKQNLGSVHHLAPLKKPSELEKHLKYNHSNEYRDGPWDSKGRPKM